MYHVDYYQSLGKGIMKKNRKIVHDKNRYKTKGEAWAMVRKQRPAVNKMIGKNRLYLRYLKKW